MGNLTRDEILARKVTGAKTELIKLAGIGDVTIRGLTLAEAEQLGELEGAAARNRLLLSAGLVNPALSQDDVDEWARNEDAGVLADLAEAIADLTGFSEGAGKSRVSRPRRRS